MLPGNKNNLTEEQLFLIVKTFNQGGYYRVDLTNDASAIVLNTLYFDSLRDYAIVKASGEAERELDWLEK